MMGRLERIWAAVATAAVTVLIVLQLVLEGHL